MHGAMMKIEIRIFLGAQGHDKFSRHVFSITFAKPHIMLICRPYECVSLKSRLDDLVTTPLTNLSDTYFERT